MGYLDNSTVTVDAILTNTGRRILAAGGQINITKFALSDDEIDYTLWNPAHTLGSNYYGAVIEDMPIIEANPDDTQMLRYKLVTLPKNIGGIPIVSIGNPNLVLSNTNADEVVTPTVTNLAGANNTLGYTAIISNNQFCKLTVAPGGQLANAAIANQQQLEARFEASGITNFLDDEVAGVAQGGVAAYAVGRKFLLAPRATTVQRNLLLTIIANETGGFKTVNVTILPNNIADISTTQQATGGAK